MSSPSRAKLRTKTGCLTCRRRRKKCNERYPLCERCAISGRQCLWPTAAGLLDTRFATHDRSRHRTATGSIIKVPHRRSEFSISAAGEKQATTEKVPVIKLTRFEILMNSESELMRETMACNLKQIIIRHFVEHYYSLILLPNCHPGFYDGWLNEIQDLMVHHKSLFYSVLACAASHLHFIDGSSQMHHLALTCYSTSLKEVSHLLAKTSRLENHNGLLMSVMLLYLHGCIGCDTIADIPCHVNAAARILAMRLFRRSININGLFDRLAIESVLYQTFLVMTGLWSEPTRLDFHFDPRFWMKAEKLLTQSTCFPEGSTSLNSPVLGVPVSFFRLGILLRQQYLDSLPRKSAIIDQLQPEVEAWQETLFYNYRTRTSNNYDKFISEETYYRDASYLYIIIISVLLEQLSRMETTIGPTPMESSDCWQINTAVQILQSHRFDTGWSRCFIGNWPVYTLGFLISSPEDKKLVLADLENRWDKQRSTQVNRFKIDLENTWASRKEYSSID